MVCKKCNFENEATAKFCENCGANLQEIKNPIQVNKNLNRLIIGCLVLLYGLSVVLIYVTYNNFKLRERNSELGNNTIPEMKKFAGYDYQTGDIDINRVRDNSNYWYKRLQIPIENRHEQIINENFLNEIKEQIMQAEDELNDTSNAFNNQNILDPLVLGLMLCELAAILFLLIVKKLQLSFGITAILLIIWLFIGLFLGNIIKILLIELSLVFFVAALIVLVYKYAFAKNQNLL